LECRCPLLDHRVVELALSIPYAAITAGSGPKPLLTSTFRDLIPAPLRSRKKSGFQIPLGHWFRGELRGLVDELLLSRESFGRGYFHEESIRRLLAEHRSGRWDHGDRIWALLFLELWQRTYIDSVPGA
jgi:asparagine synthase (glutamine-hydrolysing)